MDIIHNIFFFIVAIGILVTFHEYGHYWVARRAGVKVLRFSVGFGRPLISWTRKNDKDSVEFVISAIPLGGYVKMLDEREGDVLPEERHRAFNTQPVKSRFAIVSAGPIFNFILAIFLYWLVFIIGSDGMVPILGEPVIDSIAETAGIQAEDEAIAVGSRKVLTWNQLRVAIIDQGLGGGELELTIKDVRGFEVIRLLDLGELQLLQDQDDIIDKIGLTVWTPALPPIIGGVLQKSAAENAGLGEGDLVQVINGHSISAWKELVQVVKNNPGNSIELLVENKGEQRRVTLTPETIRTNQGDIGRIGAYQRVPREYIERMSRHVKHDVVTALGKAIQETWTMSILTLRVLGKMVVGDASIKNISGPITIAQYAGITAKIGFTKYLGLLAIISLSLGVLNFLPIPVLDGGHLLYFIIEIIRGTPLSDNIQVHGQRIGIGILGVLMTVAIFNDIQRLLQ